MTAFPPKASCGRSRYFDFLFIAPVRSAAMSAVDPSARRSARAFAAPPVGRQNRFYMWRASDTAPSRFDPAQLEFDERAGDVRYFAGVARELDERLRAAGLTVLLTWQLDAFDPGLAGAIVLLVGDEKHQLPSYAPAVRAIFKTGGTRRNPLRDTLATSPAVRWRLLLRELRNMLLATRRRGLARSGAAPVFELPMGYFGLTEVDWVAPRDRPLDVFFAGSIEAAGGFTVRPRLAARREMARALEHARQRLPAMRVEYRTAGPFANPTDTLGPESYSRRLMSAKIALCPRGNFDETFRLVEAAKSGCVAITERLPARRYHRGCPAVQLDAWDQLPDALERLLSDPNELAERATAMRAWWDEQLAEPAVARYIVTTLDRRAVPR